MNTAMLTGATGFIGSHIAEKLLSQNVSLNIFVRRKNSYIDLLEKKGARVFAGDSDTPDILKNSITGVDIVIHCAGATTAVSEKEYLKANHGFTSEILGNLKDGQKFLLISSQAAAGPSHAEKAITEEAPPRPVTPYGKSKLAAETAVRKWGKNNQNRFTILRPSIVYGPRERDLFNYFKLVHKGLFITVGKSSKRLSMIHVADLVNAVSDVSKHPFTGTTYFVSNDESYSWRDIKKTLKKALDRNSLLSIKIPEFAGWLFASFFEFTSLVTRKPGLIKFEKITEIRQDGWICSNRKIRDELHWRPLLSLEEGFRKTGEWYLMEGWYKRGGVSENWKIS